VSTGNQELCNDNGIKLVKEIDPTGSRTLGVLTKTDISDPVEVLKALRNESETVKYAKGFTAVINRNKK